MVWVRAEYAEELAVVSAWLTALLPWSLSYGTPGGSRYVAIRFPFVIFENIAGLGQQFDGTRLITPWSAMERTVSFGLQEAYSGSELTSRYGTTDPGLGVTTLLDAVAVAPNYEAVWAYLLWAVGLVVLGLAVVLSLLMYFETDVAAAFPYDVVRTMGVLLGVTAVLYSAATVMLYLQFPGLYLPIGPFLYVALAYILLTVDRTGAAGSGAPEDAEGAA